MVKQQNQNAYLAVIFAIVLLFQSANTFGASLQDALFGSRHDEQIEKTLLDTSRKLNAQLPMMIDKETRLDLTVVVDKQLYYKYTLVNYSVDEIYAESLLERMEANQKKNLCNNKDIITMLKLGVEQFYIVSDKSGKLIGNIKISAKSCRW